MRFAVGKTVAKRPARRFRLCAGAVAAALLLLPATAAMALEPFYFLGVDTGLGGWDTRVYSEPAVADPAWTTVVYARRASKTEVAARTAEPAGPRPQLNGAAHALNGTASYYWQDQMTASGEVFNKRDMTAAHKTLPLGSRVKVTNLANGRSAVLRINDRGPYVPGRVIDVSEAAADVLGMRQVGLAPVKVDLVK